MFWNYFKRNVKQNITNIEKNINTQQYVKQNVLEIINKINSPYHVKGHKQFESLKNEKIDKNVVVFTDMGDIHPYDGPTFNCTTVILNKCDKNFVYYWLNASVFTNVENIFLLSHPCEPVVFSRWYNIERSYKNRSIPNIYLAYYYDRYKNRWASEMDNVNILNEKEINILNDKLEKIKTEPDI